MNDTINNTLVEAGKRLSYEQITNITQSAPFLIVLGFIFIFINLGLYLLIAGNVRARTSDGRVLKSSMLSHANALIPIIVWVISVVAVFFLIIFPFWARIF